MARARNKIVVVSVAAGVAVILLTLVELTRAPPTNDPEPDDQDSGPRTKPEVEAPSQLPDDRAARSPGPAAKSPEPPPEPQGEPNENQLRPALQHKFGRLGEREAGDADEATTGELDPPVLPPASWASLPEEYIAGIIQEQLIPVAQSCYEDIAPKGTSGALTLSVALIGDSELGGVIDRIDVNHTATSIEGELSECVRLAAYDMEFAPPEEGQGVQEFDFTLEFSED